MHLFEAHFANTLARTRLFQGRIHGSGLFWCKEDEIQRKANYSLQRSG